ncbi:MAG: hypothetical protein ACK5P7_06080 [Bdellovibrio sp.]|jgi:hypothetical protein
MSKEKLSLVMQGALLIGGLGLIAFALVPSFNVTFSAQNFAQAEERPLPSTKFKEPYVISSAGKVTVSDSRGQKKSPAKGQLLREKATFETAPGAMVLIALTKNERLFVGPDSRVSLPVISWDNGDVERVEMERGQMRLQNLTSQPRLVVTPLTRDPYFESDLVFNLDAEAGRLNLQVLEGRTTFRGLENEEALSLTTGEEATFQSVIENGEIVFDVLLQGRRVARGKMSEKKKSPTDPKQVWWSVFDRIAKQDQAAAVQKAKEKVRDGAICKSPQGKLNECAWVCENNPKAEKKKCRLELSQVRCVRMKCDADGQWADRLEIVASQAPCLAQPLVAVCDY